MSFMSAGDLEEWNTSEVRRVSREINEQLHRTLENSYIGQGNGSTFTLGSHGDVAINPMLGDDGRVIIVDESYAYDPVAKKACAESALPPEPTLREVWAD